MFFNPDFLRLHDSTRFNCGFLFVFFKASFCCSHAKPISFLESKLGYWIVFKVDLGFRQLTFGRLLLNLGQRPPSRPSSFCLSLFYNFALFFCGFSCAFDQKVLPISAKLNQNPILFTKPHTYSFVIGFNFADRHSIASRREASKFEISEMSKQILATANGT